MRLVAVLALAALVLASTAGHAAAQGLAPGEVTARFASDTLALPQGTAGETTILLKNTKLQPVTVRLTAGTDARAMLLLDAQEVLLAPTEEKAVRVEVVPSATLPLGGFPLHVRAQEATALGTDAARNLTFTLEIVGGDLPDHTADIHPRELRATLAANASTDLLLPLRHGDDETQSYRLRAFLPAGWTATANATNVSAGATETMLVRLSASAIAANGTGRLVIDNTRDARASAVVDLHLVRAPPPQNATRNETTPPESPRENETAPPEETPTPPPRADETPKENETAAPASTPPPRNETRAPADEPPAPLPPAPSEPEATLTLRVEPGLVVLAPGGVAHARLVAVSAHDATVAVRLELPPGLASDLHEVTLDLKAHEEHTLTFLLEAEPDLPDGTLLDGALVALDGSARPARFQVRLEAPAPPVELASLSAPDEGDGRQFALAATGMAAFAAGVGMSALGLVWTRKKWGLLLVGLYARLRPYAVLEHPVRQSIVALVQARPGLTIREAQRELDLANGAIAHHLRTLEKAGALKIVGDGSLRRLYLPSHGRVQPVPPLSDRILAIVREREETTPSALAEALGVSRQAVHYHLQKMIREGRLRARVDGRETYLRAAPQAPQPSEYSYARV